MVNDLTGVVVRSMAFGMNGTHASDWTLNGNPITVTGSIEGSASSDEDIYINCDVHLGGPGYFDVTPSGSSVNLHLKNVDLNGQDLTIAHNNNAGSIEMAGAITGNGNIKVWGGPVSFSGSSANTFQGTLTVTTINDGLCDIRWGDLTLRKQSGLAVPGNIRVESGARLGLGHSDQIADDAVVQIYSSFRSCFGNQLSSSFHLNGYNETIGSLTITNVATDTNVCLVATENGMLTVSGSITSRSDNNNTVPRITGFLNLPSMHNIILAGSADASLQIDAQMSGPGGFSKYGDPTLILTGNNSFGGGVSVLQGLIDARHNNAFGAATSPVQLLWTAAGNGGALLLRNVAIGLNPLYSLGGDQVTPTAAGSRITSFGTCSWGGPVNLWTNLVVLGGDMAFSGQVSGAGGFYFLNIGTAELGGTQGNDYAGPTVVYCPLLQLNKPSGVTAFGGPLVVGGNSSPSCEARWLQDYQHTFANVTVYGNGFVNLNSHHDDFSVLTFNGGTVSSGSGELGIYGPVTVNGASTAATIFGTVGLPSGVYPNNPFVVQGGSGAGCDLNINGALIGAGNLVKLGPGTLCLNSDSSYTGATFVREGVLAANSAGALGANNVGQGTIVYSNATLQIGPGTVLSEPLSLSGSGAGGPMGALNVAGNATFNSQFQALNYFELSSAATVRVEGAGSIFTVNGIISGNGDLTKSGPGRMVLGGTYDNSYAGNTYVNGGALELSKAVGVTAIPANLVIGTGAIGSSASVRQNSSFQIVGNVTLYRGGTWDLNGTAEGFSNPDHPVVFNGGGSIQTGAGILYLPPGNSLTYNASASSGGASISGQIGLDAGTHVWSIAQHFDFGLNPAPDLDISALIVDSSTAAGIEKQGAGRLRLGAANTYTGPSTVTSGNLQVDGNPTQSAIFLNGGILSGSGRVGRIVMGGGTISPGNSGPAILTSGIFNQDGGRGTLRIELNGPSVGSGYDQLNVAFASSLVPGVTLTGVRLDLSLGFAPSPGTQFTILNYTSISRASYVVGTFAGLPQGASIAAGGHRFVIDYAGGSGNDVVLTDAGVLPALTINLADPGSVRLLWPASATGYALQAATNLSSPSWAPVSASPTVVDGNNVVVEPITGGTVFYRLFQ